MATTPQTNATIAGIADIIRAHDDFVLCGHVSPDGDCLGSQLALFHALKALGKRAECVLVRDEPVGGDLEFLPGIEHMVPAASFTGTCGVFVGVDVPTRERIGDAQALLDACTTSITIDHHASETTMCEHVYVDPDSASASVIVWELVKLLVDEPPFESALCAYTGLATDTGSFQYQNCDARAFSAASEMVARGVDPSYVAGYSFQSRSLASLKLEALVIERIRFVAGGDAAISWLCQSDIDAAGAVKADVEPLVDVVRSLQGIRVACLLREQDGRVRGSLRSKDDTDVASLARELGGGGHKAAAGLTLDMPLDGAVGLLAERIGGILDPVR